MRNINFLINKIKSNYFLNCKNIFIISLSFVAIIAFSNFIVSFYSKFVKISYPFCWPIGVFEHRMPSWKHLLVAITVLVIFGFIINYLARIKYKIPYVIFAAIILVLGTNLIQGWRGYIDPIVGGGEGGIEYYHDAIKIKNVYYFLSHFEQLQPSLLCHSAFHPPGAVLTIYLLLKILVKPVLLSVTIAIVSVSLSVFFLYKILLNEFEDEASKYASFLFILIPSVQIYYLATIDAIIAGFLLGALYFFMHPRFFISIIGSVVFIFLASFLTFLFIFILPVIVGFDILVRRNIHRTVFILLCLGIIYIMLYLFFHFNYINSFITAFHLESQFFTNFINYIFTRLQAIFEIILFFGPFLTVMTIRGIRAMKKKKLHLLIIFAFAMFSLISIFIGGAFERGETARACLFMYPYLIFPVVAYLEESKFSIMEKKALLILVFIQSAFMQMFGNYVW